jgi:hypothetical protein
MRIGITGHQRLNAEDAWSWVRLQFADVIRRHVTDQFNAYSSLAIGADQEFADVALERGGRLHVIVPSSGYEATFKTDQHLARYKYLVSKATTVKMLDYSNRPRLRSWQQENKS